MNIKQMKNIYNITQQKKLDEDDERIVRLRKNFKELKKRNKQKNIQEQQQKIIHSNKRITKEQFYEIANVENFEEFEKFLSDILFKKTKREKFYRDVIEIDYKMFEDTFENFGYNLKDFFIEKWWQDCLKESPFTYNAGEHFYQYKLENSDCLLFMLHSLIMRGMNATVCDFIEKGKARQVYFVQNDKNDVLSFSNINIMPHSKQCEQEFGIVEWLDKDRTYIESTKEKNWMWSEIIF